MSRTNSMYDSGEYLKHNPDYHQKDAPWKAKQIIKMLKKHNISPSNICEIGCGSGEILNQLNINFSDIITYTGYDISPYAIEISKQKEKENIQFYNEDFLLSDRSHDLLLVIDVVEHIENYIEYLKVLRGKGDYKIFHFPLEMSFRHILFSKSTLLKYRYQFGHLHHFSKETVIDTLRYCGYEIIDTEFTNRIDNISLMLKRILYSPLQLSFWLFPELTSKMTGAYGLIVLAK